jgi:hypothetical protein
MGARPDCSPPGGDPHDAEGRERRGRERESGGTTPINQHTPPPHPTPPFFCLQTTNLLLAAGDAALTSSPAAVPALPPLAAVAALHRDTAASLGVDAATVADVEALLGELTQLLVGVSIVQELTPRARDSLVSFGERLSTRLFAAHLRAEGVPARAVDAFAAGLTTTDDFGAADVDYGASLPALKRALGGGGGQGGQGRRAPPPPPPPRPPSPSSPASSAAARARGPSPPWAGAGPT